MLNLLGHVGYAASRKAAKIAVDVRVTANTVLEGSVYDGVEAFLGKGTFNELCQGDALILETIFYCQEELSTLEKSLQASRKILNPNYDELERKKRLINHDFLVLKLQPRNPNEPALYIKAEKVAGVDDNNSKAGIHITIHDGLVDEAMQRRCCLHSIHCNDHTTRMGLGHVIDVLKKEDTKYDARNANCWDYTRRTTKKLLDLACEKALASGRSGNECERLRWEKEHLETNLMKNHVVNTGSRIKTYVKTQLFS